MAGSLTSRSVVPRVLDRLLPRAAARAAAPSGIRFTEGQLYYELCRLLVPAHLCARRARFTVPAPLRYSMFRAALDRSPDLPGLITSVPPRTARPGRHTPEPDLFDYGLPRLLVCTCPAVAQMLRVNGMSMESATPVLSAAELPVHPGITAMLDRAGGTIYVLHEASTDGMAFPQRLPDLTEVPDGVRVVPLGLRPRQAMGLHLFHREHTVALGPPPGTTRLDSRENAWLQRGRVVELEAVSPAALLRTAHRLVRGVRVPRAPLLDLRRARESGFLTWPAA